jgi:hypothetical protein
MIISRLFHEYSDITHIYPDAETSAAQWLFISHEPLYHAGREKISSIYLLLTSCARYFVYTFAPFSAHSSALRHAAFFLSFTLYHYINIYKYYMHLYILHICLSLTAIDLAEDIRTSSHSTPAGSIFHLSLY